MVTNYDPRKDIESSKYERVWYEFFEVCVISGDYRQGLRQLIKEDEEGGLPSYFKEQFEPIFRKKIKESDKARRGIKK